MRERDLLSLSPAEAAASARRSHAWQPPAATRLQSIIECDAAAADAVAILDSRGGGRGGDISGRCRRRSSGRRHVRADRAPARPIGRSRQQCRNFRRRRRLRGISPATLRQVITTNLLGAFYCSQAAVRRMSLSAGRRRRRDRQHIVPGRPIWRQSHHCLCREQSRPEHVHARPRPRDLPARASGSTR